MSVKPPGGRTPAGWFFFTYDYAFKRRARGFTAIELVIVIVVIGVLAAVITPRWYQADVELHGAAQQLKNDIRYMQGLAMTNGQRHRITFNAANYQLTNNTGANVLHPLTGAAIVPYSRTGNVTLDANGFNASFLAFDGLGRPYNGAALLGAVTSVTLNQTGGASRILSIAPQTGFVTVTP